MAIRYERADLIVVGGGLLGCWAAYLAQRKGLSCLLVDESLPDQASGLSAQQVRPLLWSTTPSALLPLKKSSLKTYLNLEKELGLSLLDRSQHWAIAPAESAQWQTTLQVLQENDVPFEQISPLQMANRLPQLIPPQEVWAAVEESWNWHNFDLRNAMWNELRKMGVKCLAETRVTRLDLEYDQPTALTADLALRGTYLWMAAGSATSSLMEGLPTLEMCTHYRTLFGCPPVRPNFPALPHLSVLFQNNAMQLESAPGASSLTLSRIKDGGVAAETEADSELAASEVFLNRWIPLCQAECTEPAQSQSRQAQQTQDRLPLISAHPQRGDVLVSAGLGLDYTWLAPAASGLGLDILQGHSQARSFDCGRESLKART